MPIWKLYQERVRKNCLDDELDLNGLAYWRNKLFYNTILYFLPLGILSAIPGITISFASDKTVLGLFDAFAVFIGFIIAFNGRLYIEVRKMLFIFMLYCLAIALIYYLGSYGPGLLYLLAITIFCTLIFSNVIAYLSVVANTIICFMFGLAIFFKFLSGPVFDFYNIGSWLAVSLNMLILSTVVAILLPLIFNGLQHSNDRYEMVARATSDTICDWNLEKDSVTYNTGIYQVFGYSLDDVMYDSKWWLDQIHPEDKQRISDLINDTLKNGGLNFRAEYRFRCADDSYKYIFYRSYVLRDPAGNPVRIISSMQDITKNITYVKAIERQNRKLKEISWRQSHVVRAPLTRIMGLVSLLIDLPPRQINKAEIVGYIETSANELDTVIREIIKHAEIDIADSEAEYMRA